MYTRLDGKPVYEYRDGVIQAYHYNHVQHALKTSGDSIRLYHAHATLILGEQLGQFTPDNESEVIPFSRDKD